MRLGLRLVATLPHKLHKAGQVGVGKLLHRRMMRLLHKGVLVGVERADLFPA